jgi:hypothetical protein
VAFLLQAAHPIEQAAPPTQLGRRALQIKAAPEYKDSRDIVAIVTAPAVKRDTTPNPGW